MIDYRDIHYTPEDLNNVRRRIRNSALTVEELIESLTDAEVAAMWFEVEGEYNYCFLRDNPAEQILFYYLRETLIKAIASEAPRRILCKRFSTKLRISRFQCA